LEEKKRLSDYAVGIFDSIQSRKGIKKAIEKRLVFINGEIGHTFSYVQGGEILELRKAKVKQKPKANIDLEVVFEDEYLAIINKPAGIVVSGNKKRTIENALEENLKPSSETDALDYPEPIHRLDHPTTGALLIGKTASVVSALNKLFEARTITKTYHAVTQGKSKTRGTIKTDIKNKSALTKWKLLKSIPSEKFEALNLIAVFPETGRRHQIRIHLAEKGVPILGDQLYGKKGKILKGKGLYLHASGLSFEHPITKELIEVTIALPKKIEKLFEEK